MLAQEYQETHIKIMLKLPVLIFAASQMIIAIFKVEQLVAKAPYSAQGQGEHHAGSSMLSTETLRLVLTVWYSSSYKANQNNTNNTNQ